jgi:hypothetical protein
MGVASRSSVIEQVALQIPGFDMPGAHLVRGTVRGVLATLMYRLDRVEAERRAVVAIPTLEGLDVLMQLPVGLPVPRGMLSPADRRVLAGLPSGCVEFMGGDVVRLVTRPVTLEVAAVSHADWRRGLEHAGRFGAYCTRLLALSGVPEELAEAQVLAGYYGVGLVVNVAAQAVVVAEPEKFVRERATAAGWLLAEEVFALGLAGGRVLPA